MGAAEGVPPPLLPLGLLRYLQEPLRRVVQHGRLRQPHQGPRLSAAPPLHQPRHLTGNSSPCHGVQRVESPAFFGCWPRRCEMREIVQYRRRGWWMAAVLIVAAAALAALWRTPDGAPHAGRTTS